MTEPLTDYQRLWCFVRAAYHESGHAVAAHVLGYRVTRLQLSPPPDANGYSAEEYAGHCCVPFVTRVRGEPRPHSSYWRRHARKALLCICAGVVAEKRFNADGTPDFFCTPDGLIALLLAHQLESIKPHPVYAPAREVLQTAARALVWERWLAAERLIEEHHTAVLELARLAVNRRVLSGNDLTRVLERVTHA